MAKSAELVTFRTIAPGLALVWAAPASRGSVQPAAIRSVALAAAGRRAPLRDFPPGPGHPAGGNGTADRAGLPWRDVTLLEGWRAPPERLRAIVEKIGALPEAPLLRLEWPLTPSAVQALARADWLRPTAAPRPFVHFFVHRLLPVTRPLAGALARLADLGLPLCAEIYLNNGATDRAEPLARELPALLGHGVRPHLLIDGEWLPPGRRVGTERALGLVGRLRGWVSGLAVPQLVVEGLDGLRRPCIPPYLRRLQNGQAEGVTYRGERFTYPPQGMEGDR